MHLKILMTKLEITTIIQKAHLLVDNISDDTMICLTVDDNNVRVDIPNMVKEREIKIDNTVIEKH